MARKHPKRPQVPIPTAVSLAVTRTLRALDAHLAPPTPEHPYWAVFRHDSTFLGAGKTPERAVTAALGTRTAAPFPFKSGGA